MKICMLSSVHSANDVRIFEKEARSLADAGHTVTIVARPPGPRDPSNVQFKLIDLPTTSRWKRPWVVGPAAVALARSTEADVVQFHDPELIPFALLLKKQGYKIVYDVHEDLPADIHSKGWIPGPVRPAMALGAELVERMAAPRCCRVIAATPAIADRFRAYGVQAVVVRNSVRLDEFVRPTIDTDRRRQAVYVGRISFDRGLVAMVECCAEIRLPLVLAGSIGAKEAEWLKAQSADVLYKGKLARSEVVELLNESLIGLNLLLPEPNYLFSLPTKLFEYMAAGLAVITSDLPKSKEIVEQAGCGFVVSIADRRTLVERLSFLAANPQCAQELGQAGQAAVSRNYNWEHDAAELRKLYGEGSLSSLCA